MKTTNSRWPYVLALCLCMFLSGGCTKAYKARHVLAAADRDFRVQNYEKAEAEYKSALRLSWLNPVAVRQLGFIYFEEGRQLAFPYLKKANEQDSNNVQVQLDLAELYGGAVGKPEEAIPLLRSVVQSNATNEQAWLLLAQLTQTNDLASLRQRLDTQIREGGPGLAAWHGALGWIDLRTNHTNDAATEFQKAVALDPKLASPHVGLAVLCVLNKDTNGVQESLKTAAELSPVRSGTRLKYVEYELQTGAGEQARQLLLDMTQKAPDYIPAWLDLMRLSFATRKYNDCQAAIEKILALDDSPPNFEATFQLGTLALAQGDVAKALSTFQRLDQSYKLYNTNSIPQVKYYLAVTHLMNHEKQNAIGDLNEALALDPDYPSAELLMAQLDYRSGHLNEAIDLLRRLIKKYPENAQAQLALAETFLGQNLPDRALEVYQRMEKSFAKNAEIPRLMGKVYVEEGKTNQARAEFEKSLGVMPDYLPTLQNITDFDIIETNFDQAHHRLASVIEKDPKSADLYAMQGKVYFYQKQTNQAEAAYSKAIELNPQFPAPYLDLARLYLGSHQEQQALDRLNALVARTNDVSALQEIGEIQQSAGRYDQARDAYEKILAINPSFGPALNNLAYLYSEHLGNLDKALQLAETSWHLSPTDPNATDTLGWILFQKHQYARALSLIQESAEKQPDVPEVQMHLGMAYYMMEEEEPARVALNEAVKPGPDFPGRDLARRCLEVLNIDPTKATPALVQQLQDLVQADPQDPVPLSRLAAIEEQRGEIEKAVQSLQTLISINPQNWPAMLRLARLEADHFKDIRKALELAQTAHVLAPDDGQASALLGELAYRTGDYPWAKSLLGEAARQSPNDASVLYRLALACYAVGQVADADTAMQKAVQSGRSFPELDQAKQFLTLRAAVKDASQAQASSAQVRQILDKDPNDVPALMVSALLAQQRGAGNEAAQIWEKVLTIYRQFAPAMRELAIYYGHSQNASDRDKAYEWAQKARSSLPDDLELAKTLGILAYDHGEYNRSMALLRDYVEKSNKDGEAYFYLGMDYYKLKSPKDSKQALQTALNLRVADNLAAKAQTVLKELNRSVNPVSAR